MNPALPKEIRKGWVNPALPKEIRKGWVNPVLPKEIRKGWVNPALPKGWYYVYLLSSKKTLGFIQPLRAGAGFILVAQMI